MAGKRKPQIPKVLKLEVNTYVGRPATSYRLYISSRQGDKLEDWVFNAVRFYGSEFGRAFLNIDAKDELEAMMRFQKLWAGLPKKEQEDD
jgi:hypothetical protein